MKGYDQWLTGGNYSKQTVAVKCVERQRSPEYIENDAILDEDGAGCGWEGEATLHTEYGTSELTPDSCADCGGEVEVID